jgi:hypothetical protein
VAPPSETARALDRERKRLTHSAAPDEPEWRRAATALAEWLDARIAHGSVEPVEQAAIARAWAAFCLGGVSEPQILRVAHIVQRAHTAIRESPRGHQDLQAAFHAAAGVLHAGLPTAIKARMPSSASCTSCAGCAKRPTPGLPSCRAPRASWLDRLRQSARCHGDPRRARAESHTMSETAPGPVAYMGPRGTFSDLAVRQAFPAHATLEASTIPAVLDCVERKAAEYGVVPSRTRPRAA